MLKRCILVWSILRLLFFFFFKVSWLSVGLVVFLHGFKSVVFGVRNLLNTSLVVAAVSAASWHSSFFWTLGRQLVIKLALCVSCLELLSFSLSHTPETTDQNCKQLPPRSASILPWCLFCQQEYICQLRCAALKDVEKLCVPANQTHWTYNVFGTFEWPLQRYASTIINETGFSRCESIGDVVHLGNGDMLCICKRYANLLFLFLHHFCTAFLHFFFVLHGNGLFNSCIVLNHRYAGNVYSICIYFASICWWLLCNLIP